jgi:hypothetical protein
MTGRRDGGLDPMRLASTRTLRREIDQAVLAGRSIAQIETEVIAPCALDDEARAALWLYADGSLARAAAGHLPVIAETGVTGPSGLI